MGDAFFDVGCTELPEAVVTETVVAEGTVDGETVELRMVRNADPQLLAATDFDTTDCPEIGWVVATSFTSAQYEEFVELLCAFAVLDEDERAANGCP